MKLYNTLSRKIEEFIPHSGNNVNMYTCGPTVYHFAHIGNLRSYIMEDVLEKSLNYLELLNFLIQIMKNHIFKQFKKL